MEGRDRAAVEVEVHVRVLTVDHVDLGEPGDLALAEHVLDELVRSDRVRLRLLLCRREGTELALDSADVGLVHVQVLDEVDLVRPAPPAPREVGKLAEREQVVRLEERHTVLEPEPLSRLDLLRIGSRVLSSTTAMRLLAVPVDDDVRECLQVGLVLQEPLAFLA